MSSNEVKSSFSPYQAMEQQWLKVFNELCYEVFYNNKLGAQLLAHMENKFFRSPVAFPDRDPSWAFFNEGRNELIRSFTVAIQSHVMESAKPQNQLLKKSKIKAK